jgi:PAS domain S-box-containing protein
MRTTEEIRQIAFNYANDGIFVHEAIRDGKPGRFVEVNDYACKMTGYSREELLKLTPLDIDRTPPETARKIVEALHQNKHIAFETVLVTKKGDEVPIEITNYLVSEGEDSIVIAVVRDITERKKAERELRISEEKFRMFFESVNDAVLVHGIAEDGMPGKFTNSNNMASSLYGYSKEEFTELRPADLNDPKRAADPIPIAYKLRKEKHVVFETVDRKKDGTSMPVEISSHCFEVKDKPIIISAIRDISERINKISELEREIEKRQLAEERIVALIDALPDIIYFKNTESRNLVVNLAFAKLLGLKKEEIEGKTDMELLPTGLAEHCIKQDKDVIRGGRLMQYEEEHSFHGKRIFQETIKVPLYDKMDAIVGLVGVTRDITERRLAEQQLRDSEERFRAAFDNAGVGASMADLKGRFIRVNRFLCDLLGYSEEEMLSKTFSEVTHPDDVQIGLDAVKKMVSGELDHTSFEKRYIKKDGQLVYLIINPAIIRDKDGNPQHFVALFQDITGRKQAEEFSGNILQSVGEGIIVVKPDFTIISANTAYCDQVGMDCDDIKGKHCYEVSHHIQRPCYEEGEDCPIKHTFETREPATSLHVHHNIKGEEIYVEVRSYPLKDHTGKVVSAIEVINNITDRRRLEDQLRQSQKMEAIGTLTGGIAHDFNNLLTTILGYGEFLLDEIEEDSPLQAYVDMILASGHKAANLTQSLLAFSRKQIIHPVKMDINKSIEKTEKLLSRLIGEDIEIKLNLWDKPLNVMADSVLFEQVLINLANNARDAMPDGGSFVINTEPYEIDDDFIKTEGFGRAGRFVRISVTDNGKGMDNNTLEQIFEPFFTTKDVGKGTGLGLSVAYGIIRQHEGYISVHSEPENGTTFSIYLSLARASTEKKEILTSSAQSEGGNETVLIAEDDRNVRDLIRITLEKSGYHVLETQNGEEAVKTFKANKDGIDLLMLDIIMPKMNGIEAYGQIKLLQPDIKAMFISGYPRGTIDKYSLDKDIPLVSKPVTPKTILNLVRETLDSPKQKNT